MLMNKKYILYGIILNVLFWFGIFIIPYILSGVTFTEYLNSVFGENEINENLKTLGMLFAITTPLSSLVIMMIDFFFGIIYPKKWLTVTLHAKHKYYFHHIDRGTGLPVEGYTYSFVFKDKKDKKHKFRGNCSQYESLVKGIDVKIRVKAAKLIEVVSVK